MASLNLQPARTELPGGASKYVLHPAALDACLQLSLIAAHLGRPEDLQQAYVPVSIEEMSLWKQDNQEEMPRRGTCVASGKFQGLRALHASAQLFLTPGAPLLEIKGLRCVTYLNGNAHEEDERKPIRMPYMRLVWKPDIDFLTNETAQALFPPTGAVEYIREVFDGLNRLTAYIIVQYSLAWQDKYPEPQSETLRRFLSWLRSSFVLAKKGNLRFGHEALTKSWIERGRIIEEIFRQLSSVPEARLIKQNYLNLTDILEGKTSALEVALQNDALKDLYVNGVGVSYAYPQLKNIVELLVHKNPRARILEIGAGTGGATRKVMEVLRSCDGFQFFQEYTFTDVSSSFLAETKTEFGAISGMTYTTLDIERNPQEQGLDSSYDLIIASQVLHATVSLSQTVENARSLLKPGGKMVLLELTRVHVATGLVLGTLPGFWDGVQEGRTDSPLISKEKWHTILIDNGFSGIDIVLGDHPKGYETASVIVTTAIEPALVLHKQLNPVSIILMAAHELRDLQQAVSKALTDEGISCHNQSLTFSSVPCGAYVIYLVDATNAADIFQKEEVFLPFQALINQASSFLWVSTGDLVKAQRPLNSLITGLLRTISTENPPCKTAQLELGPNFDQSSPKIASLIVRTHESLRTRTANATENFFTYHNGCVHVSRLIPDQALNTQFKASTGLRHIYQTRSLRDLEPVRANFEHVGILSSLYFQPDVEFAEELQGDWIEIKTMAIGLNVKVRLGAKSETIRY